MNILPIHYEELETIFNATVGRGLRSISIVAATTGEGVSMLAYALARRAASNGKRALLVDLNTAKPSVAPRLGLESAEWRPENQSWKEAVVPCGSSGLDILPAPCGSNSVLQLRDPETLKTYLDEWCETYDIVVCDTSSLTAVNQGNLPAERIAQVTDATVMVALAARTPETKVNEAILRLRNVGANLIGTVLNDQFNPSIVDELRRETLRLEKILPRFMRWLRDQIRVNPFLNQEI